MTHRNDGRTWRASKVLDDLPIGLLNGRGMWCFRCIRCVRLRGRGGGFRTLRIEQQLDARFTTIIAAAHVLPEACPSSGASGSSGYCFGPDFALAKRKMDDLV